jgi:hypothetical protein
MNVSYVVCHEMMISLFFQRIVYRIIYRKWFTTDYLCMALNVGFDASFDDTWVSKSI